MSAALGSWPWDGRGDVAYGHRYVRHRADALMVMRMTKWEYSTVPLLSHATKQILDQWGEDGWELVAVLPGPTGEQMVAYMKREKEG